MLLLVRLPSTHPHTPHQAKLYPRVLAAMKPGATLGLSHGFLLGVMKNDGVDFRKDINVVLVAPKVGGAGDRGVGVGGAAGILFWWRPRWGGGACEWGKEAQGWRQEQKGGGQGRREAGDPSCGLEAGCMYWLGGEEGRDGWVSSRNHGEGGRALGTHLVLVAPGLCPAPRVKQQAAAATGSPWR